jgi:hypothetical protein
MMMDSSTSCRKVCATQETIVAGPARIASGRLIRSINDFGLVQISPPPRALYLTLMLHQGRAALT